jgi:aspartyl-tRNA(Asn)/glutamyl-tRNA(Gln) amidotransferase subunit A
MADQLWHLTIAEAAALLADRRLSPVELTEAVLSRIDAVDRRVKAYVTLLADEALDEARQAEKDLAQGPPRSPLHGIPMALKDLYDVAGVPTLCGSRTREGHIAVADSAVAERLKEAGANILGKVVTHEYAYGTLSPPVCNPWDLQRNAGGSSGGSAAALAAGECLGAMGTDTGGSIRGPACLTGVVGLKPTFGRVSRYGVVPLSSSLDHAGPMARTVEDAAIILQAVAGPDSRDSGSLHSPVPDFRASLRDGVRGARVGVPRDYFCDDLQPDVARAFETALKVFAELGAEVIETELPNAGEGRELAWALCMPEASEFHAETLRTMPDRYTPEVRERLEAGSAKPAVGYVSALRRREEFAARFLDLFDSQRLDVTVTPTMPIVAGRIGETWFEEDGFRREVLASYGHSTSIFNTARAPGISIPCGFSRSGMPIGLHIGARPQDEANLLRVAYAYEAATDWHLRHPQF